MGFIFEVERYFALTVANKPLKPFHFGWKWNGVLIMNRLLNRTVSVFVRF